MEKSGIESGSYQPLNQDNLGLASQPINASNSLLTSSDIPLHIRPGLLPLAERATPRRFCCHRSVSRAEAHGICALVSAVAAAAFGCMWRWGNEDAQSVGISLTLSTTLFAILESCCYCCEGSCCCNDD